MVSCACACIFYVCLARGCACSYIAFVIGVLSVRSAVMSVTTVVRYPISKYYFLFASPTIVYLIDTIPLLSRFYLSQLAAFRI